MYLMPVLQSASSSGHKVLSRCLVGRLAMKKTFEMGTEDCIVRAMLLEKFVFRSSASVPCSVQGLKHLMDMK